MNTVTSTILEVAQTSWFQPVLLVAMVAVAATAGRRFVRKAKRSAASLLTVLALLGVTPAMMTAWVTEAVSRADLVGVAEITPMPSSFFGLPTEWTAVTDSGEEFLCSPSLEEGLAAGFVCDYRLLAKTEKAEATKGGFFETFTVTTEGKEHYACDEASNSIWKCPTDRQVFEYEGVTS